MDQARPRFDRDAGIPDARSVDATDVVDLGVRGRLDGRGAVVAGAGQGIGRQVAHVLSQSGAIVLCVDQDADAARHVAHEVGGFPAVADVRQAGEVERALEQLRYEVGRLDIIVDIVGMARYGPFLETTAEDWEWTFDLVLRHARLFGQIGGRMMAQQERRADNGQRGVLAFVASASGVSSAPFHAPYGAAKAGLMSLVRTMAVELGPMGIRANAVAPGFVWTPRIASMIGEEGRERNRALTPLRAVTDPADIACALHFLVSDLSMTVSGQSLSVDGAIGLKFPYPLEA